MQEFTGCLSLESTLSSDQEIMRVALEGFKVVKLDGRYNKSKDEVEDLIRRLTRSKEAPYTHPDVDLTPDQAKLVAAAMSNGMAQEVSNMEVQAEDHPLAEALRQIHRFGNPAVQTEAVVVEV